MTEIDDRDHYLDPFELDGIRYWYEHDRHYSDRHILQCSNLSSMSKYAQGFATVKEDIIDKDCNPDERGYCHCSPHASFSGLEFIGYQWKMPDPPEYGAPA